MSTGPEHFLDEGGVVQGLRPRVRRELCFLLALRDVGVGALLARVSK